MNRTLETVSYLYQIIFQGDVLLLSNKNLALRTLKIKANLELTSSLLSTLHSSMLLALEKTSPFCYC